MREEIVRLGGPADWALPFWNYSDTSPPDVLAAPARLPRGDAARRHGQPAARRAAGPGHQRGAQHRTRTWTPTTGCSTSAAFTPRSGVGVRLRWVRAPVGHPRGGGPPGRGAGGRPARQRPRRGRRREPPRTDDRLRDRRRRTRSSGCTTRTSTGCGRRGSRSGAATAATRQRLAGSTPRGRRARGRRRRTRITTRQMLDPAGRPSATATPTCRPDTDPRGGGRVVRRRAPARRRRGRGPAELVGATEQRSPLGTQRDDDPDPARPPSAGPAARATARGCGVPTGVAVYLRLENITATGSTRAVSSSTSTSAGRPARRLPGPQGRDGVDVRRHGDLARDGGTQERARRDLRHHPVARALATSGQWDPAKVDVTFVPIPDAPGAGRVR